MSQLPKPEIAQIICLLFSLFVPVIMFAQAPTVTSISGYRTVVGASVTVNGTNFNTTPSNNAVFFGSTRATVSAATSTSLTVSVPYGSTAQALTVTNTATKLTGYSPGAFVQSFSPVSSVGSYTFDPAVSFDTGENPYAVALADLDGDGKPDLLTANATGNTLTVLRNRGSIGAIGSSTFDDKLAFSTGPGASAVRTADLDGDGKLDVVIGYQNGNQISIFINTSSAGTISFGTRIDLTAGSAPAAVDIADIDNDGKPDIVTANAKANTISIIRNTTAVGVVSFASQVSLNVGNLPNAVDVADLNGDNKPEIIVSNFESKTLSILRNIAVAGTIGAGSFAPKIDISVAGSPTAVAVIDLDGDASMTPEIITTYYTPTKNVVAVSRNTITSVGFAFTASSFAAPVEFTTGSEPMGIALGDIDGDQKTDLITTNYNAKSVSVLRNTSTSGSITTSSFAAKVDFPTGEIPVAASVADLDADKFPDIVTACYGDNSIVILHTVNSAGLLGPAATESTASISAGSFINTDIYDPEWALDAPIGYTIATHDGTTINAAGNAPANAGRFVYFSTMGSVTPLVYIPGTLQFTAKGTGTIEIQLLTTWNMQIYARKTFTLTSSFQDYSWTLPNMYPQNEYVFAVMVNGGNSSVQATAQFKKNMTLALQQGGMSGTFRRYRADQSSLIGNVESNYAGYSDQFAIDRKKYLQHSAYSRMRFTTDATKFVVEYVRDSYDKQVVNLFPYSSGILNTDFNASGNIVTGNHTIADGTKVVAGKTYTIAGLKTTSPTYVWFNAAGTPLGGPQALTNVSPGTTQNPLYQLTAPAGAVKLALLVQRIVDMSNYLSPSNDTYQVYSECSIREGTVAALTASGPIAFTPFTGNVPTKISGIAVFVNGKLYNYYQIEGTDLAKRVSYLTDNLPPGTKTVEIMMNGQGTYTVNNVLIDPRIKRSGTYLRAVYFPASNTSVFPAATQAANSILFIHDSILSGFNISENAQNNVWMMKIKNDPAYGFTGDIFSEGYSGRILYTDIDTDPKADAFAAKLISYGVKNFWFQIGVNDYGFVTPLHRFYKQYNRLVEKMKALKTDVKIYVQAIGPVIYADANAETYADNGLASTGPQAKDFIDVQHAIATAPTHSYCEYVDFENLFPPSIENLGDGIHPSDAGNALYAAGIKNKSTLLGTALPATPLAFARTAIRQFVQSIETVSVITAQGGKPPYTFTCLSNNVPAGLFFNPDGVITGIPTVNGTFTLNVQVKDANNTTVVKNFDLTVKPIPSVRVAPAVIYNAQTGVAYNTKLMGAGGYGKYTITKSGTFPPGIDYDIATNTLSGTCNTAGTYNFRLTAVDHWGFTGYTDYSFVVGTGTPPPLKDNMYVTASVSPDGNLMVVPHLHDSYTTDIYGYYEVYYRPPSGADILLGKKNAIVARGQIDGAPVNYGPVPSNGAFKARLDGFSIAPASSDNKTFTWDALTLIDLTYGTYTGPLQPVTDNYVVNASVNANGDAIIRGDLSRAYSGDIYAYVDVYVVKNGVENWLTGFNLITTAGNAQSASINAGHINFTKPYTIKVHNYGLDPSALDGRTFNYTVDTLTPFN
ncbi:VCBS repeat-containing protein [Mucilaginibacter sp. 21P]|nr:VCBS repeat-containing protein [Mucilaginibacter sp. 21P]